MRSTLFAWLLVVVVAPFALAHEGHDHKIMGVVSVIHENHLEVKATDGTVASITLNDKTKVLKGKVSMKPTDIKIGDRVVVTASSDEKGSLTAKEVKLGTIASTKTQP